MASDQETVKKAYDQAISKLESDEIIGELEKNENLRKELEDVIKKVLENEGTTLASDSSTEETLDPDFMSKLKEACETKPLEADSGDDEARNLLICEIIIECIMLVFSVAGFKVSVNIKVVAKSIIPAYKSSRKLQKAVDNLIAAYKKGGVNTIATSVWDVSVAAYEENIFSKVFDAIRENMSWFDWVKTSAVLIATIAATMCTGGVAMIAKIALNINSAISLSQKIYKLCKGDY